MINKTPSLSRRCSNWKVNNHNLWRSILGKTTINHYSSTYFFHSHIPRITSYHIPNQCMFPLLYCISYIIHDNLYTPFSSGSPIKCNYIPSSKCFLLPTTSLYCLRGKLHLALSDTSSFPTSFILSWLLKIANTSWHTFYSSPLVLTASSLFHLSSGNSISKSPGSKPLFFDSALSFTADKASFY